MTFAASVITLYPEMFPGPLGISLAGKALDDGAWTLETVALRGFGKGKHRMVDDTPAGGGAGMVLRADVLADAIDSIGEDTRPLLLMSPRGRVLDQKYVRELARGPGAVIVCGRFEGVDQRVIEARNLTEVSIGDYILSGGEPAAMILLDAIVRLLPGVMGNDQSGMHESFETGILEHPHYTRPAEWEGMMIPEILTSGNHKKIAEWQREQAEKLTKARRPDLLGNEVKVPSNVDKELLLKLETDLWIGETRFNDAYMNELFEHEFSEIGCSGRVYERQEMLFGLKTPQEIEATLPLPEFEVRVLSSELVQTRYKSIIAYENSNQTCHRSSIWKRGGKHGWTLMFHQGTPRVK